MAPKQITFGYNPLGQFTSIARYDFVGTGPMVDIATAALSYDGANRLTGLAYTGDTGQIAIDSFTFTLDAANRITERSLISEPVPHSFARQCLKKRTPRAIIRRAINYQRCGRAIYVGRTIAARSANSICLPPGFATEQSARA